jgi:hypothetical protein
MKRHYKRLSEIETFRIREPEMLMQNSRLPRMVRFNVNRNVMSTRYSTRQIPLRDKSKSLSSRMSRTSLLQS